MILDNSTQIIARSVILGVGALTNVLLILCLAHTWRCWRQVKLYIILLAVGNVLHVVVTQGAALAQVVNPETSITGSTASCRFLTFAATLGPSLSAMAVAALALHVLLTAITGNQGNRLRHALVLGLFVLLGLAMPLVKIPFSQQTTYNAGEREMSFCHFKTETYQEYLQFSIGQSVSNVFFPLFVTLVCSLAAGVLFCTASRATAKGDEDKSDLILTYLMGVALLVFCVPYYVSDLYLISEQLMQNMASMNVMVALSHVLHCFPFVTALISIVFAYVHAYRNRGEFYVTSGAKSTASGERQKLVN